MKTFIFKIGKREVGTVAATTSEGASLAVQSRQYAIGVSSGYHLEHAPTKLDNVTARTVIDEEALHDKLIQWGRGDMGQEFQLVADLQVLQVPYGRNVYIVDSSAIERLRGKIQSRLSSLKSQYTQQWETARNSSRSVRY